MALLQLIGRGSAPDEEEQILRDFAASHVASWSKARNTLCLLERLTLLRKADGRVFLSPAIPTTELRGELAQRVAEELAARITTSGAPVLQARAPDAGLWLDVKLLPPPHDGLPLWAVEFDVAVRDGSSARFWRVADRYERAFIDAARGVNRRPRRPKHLDELEAALAAQAAHGRAAEEWVVRFEKRRLRGHLLIDQIRRVSDEDVAAGYDIVSFSGLGALAHDLFLEVKSYERVPRFFWTRNEIATAREFGEQYALVLLDRALWDRTDYMPKFIPGPYAALHLDRSDWRMEPSVFECRLTGGAVPALEAQSI